MTHKSYKLNGRQTIGGFTAWQWVAAAPGAAAAFGFMYWAPLPLAVRLFCGVVALGFHVLGVYLSGFLELNLIALAREAARWRRCDERYSPGADAPERALVVVADERAPASVWVFEPLDLRALSATTNETANGATANGASRAGAPAGGRVSVNGASVNGVGGVG